MIDSVNGVCGAKLFTTDGYKVVYKNNRNDAGVYMRSGRMFNMTEGTLKCPGGLLATEVGLNLTNVVGYQYKIDIKLLIQTLNSPPFNLSILLNSRQISLLSIPNTTDCNNIKIANFSLTFTTQSLVTNSSSIPHFLITNSSSFPLNPTQPNYLSIKSTQP
jgi:hypothetical protein